MDLIFCTICWRDDLPERPGTENASPCAHVRHDGTFCRTGGYPSDIYGTTKKLVWENESLWALDE